MGFAGHFDFAFVFFSGRRRKHGPWEGADVDIGPVFFSVSIFFYLQISFLFSF